MSRSEQDAVEEDSAGSDGGLLLVVNTNAGRVTRERVRRSVDHLAGSLATEVVHTSRPQELDRHLDRLEGRQLVMAGGDGTIHHAVKSLRRAGKAGQVPVGVIPMGSGNDLLLGLGIPDDAERVASSWTRTRVRSLDLIETEETDVVNAAGAGTGAIASARSRPFKSLLPGRVAYRIGALAAAATTAGWRVRVVADDDVVAQGDRRLLSVVVANGSTFGGGAAAAPAARPDDGRLDLVVSTATGPIARTRYGLQLRHGEHVHRRDVLVRRARHVEISGRPVPYNLDGELQLERQDRRSFTVAPSAWKLRIPDRVIQGR